MTLRDVGGFVIIRYLEIHSACHTKLTVSVTGSAALSFTYSIYKSMYFQVDDILY